MVREVRKKDGGEKGLGRRRLLWERGKRDGELRGREGGVLGGELDGGHDAFEIEIIMRE